MAREVTAQGGHGVRLGVTIFLYDFEGPAQDGAALLGLEDGDEVTENGAALAFAFWRWEVFGHVNGLPDVAELVEKAALFRRVEVDGG